MKKFSRLYPKVAIWLDDTEPKALPSLDPKFLDTFQLEMVEQIIIYGVGNGELYQALKDWLRKKRRRILVLVEDDVAVLKNFLDSKLGKDVLNEERVQLHFYEKGDVNMNLFQRIMWLGWGKTVEIIKDPRYDENAFDDFKNLLLYDRERMKWFGFEFTNLGVGYYFNFYQNLKCLSSSYSGVDVFGKAKNIPAFIVGAGPSLNKNAEFLKKIGNRGLILAGGSSIQALAAFGVKPHFGAGIDPNIWLKERFKAKGTTDFPFFYRLRINHDALDTIEGKKLYLSGSGVYRTASWFEERLNLKKDDVDEGFNVINFLTNIAVKLGCNPIVYVGLDLSYTNSAAYAKGVEWPHTMPPDLLEGLDIEGHPVMTRWIWLKESQWITIFVRENPEVKFINATEGGIGFTDVPNEKLDDVLNRVLKDHRISSDVFDFKPLNVNYEDVLKLVKELSVSLENVAAILNEMKRFYDNLKPEDFQFEFPEEVEWSLKLAEEPAFDAILAIFDEFYLQLIANSHLFYLIQRDGMSAKRAKKVIELHLERIGFLEKVIYIQNEIIHKFCE